MVVVTRRLRSVVAPTTHDQAFPEEEVLDTSYGIAGRPLADGEEEEKVYQETSHDPTATFFKPHTAPVFLPITVDLSNIRKESTITTLTWILAIAAGIFLGVAIYQIALSYPYYAATVIPIPQSGVFSRDTYHQAAVFSNLPSLPAAGSTTTLSLNPVLPFPVK